MKREDFKIFKCPDCGSISIFYYAEEEDALKEFSDDLFRDNSGIIKAVCKCGREGVLTPHEKISPEIMAEIYGNLEEDRNRRYTETGHDIIHAMRTANIDDHAITLTLIALIDDFVERTEF